MSRGPGVWQRMILERVDAGKLVILTGDNDSHSTQNAIRRAAYTLEKAGKVRLTSVWVDGRARLVACPPGMSAPRARIVTGLDGRTYRRPSTGRSY